MLMRPSSSLKQIYTHYYGADSKVSTPQITIRVFLIQSKKMHFTFELQEWSKVRVKV